MNSSYLYTIIILFLSSCSDNFNKNIEAEEPKFYSQGIQNRTAAEWEPAIGALVVWPLSIPHKLAIELANDNHLFTMVENEDSRKEAEKWFNQWNISLDNVTFIYAKQGVDAWWTRDWGPSAVFTHKNEYKLADGKYIYSTPASGIACKDSLRFLYKDENNKIKLTQIDDDATIPLAKQLDFELLDLPFNNTGGNVLTDGIGTAFSTCIIFNENNYHGVENEDFLKLNDSLLGFENYNIISNFESFGIQHIDCLLKLIDEETILVAEPPSDHELHSVYENIINELSALRNFYDKPYEILRIKTSRYEEERLAAYTNSLILNKIIYVPLFDIPQDSIALSTWEEAMPGYTVKGFRFALDDEPLVAEKVKEHYKDYGWNDGDALHCRTRAIWNPKMLFITVNTIPNEVNSNYKKKVYATIIDYSKKGLVDNKCELFWRITGESNWNSIKLSSSNNKNHFFAEIPKHESGVKIQYYISAVSNSGEKETRPKTAPIAAYEFSIK